MPDGAETAQRVRGLQDLHVGTPQEETAPALDP